MNWINNKTKIFATIFTLYVALINPYTAAYLDPNPPLSNMVEFSILISYIFLLIYLVMLYFYRTLAVQIAIAFLTLVGTDILLSKFLVVKDHKSFRLSQPEPYKNAIYFSEEFINESFAQPGGYELDKETGGVKPNNYSGKYFNVVNNRRLTVNLNSKTKRKLYIFGGSTIYNSEVPDDLTIASQLASFIPSDLGFEVVNMGVTSVHSTQQFARLRMEVKLEPDDIVVFYDGVNDVLQRIVYENQEGFMYGSPKNGNFLRALHFIARYSAIAQLLINIMADNPRDFSQELLDLSIDKYLETLIAVRAYVEAKDADFYHFLQPTLFTKTPLNDYESLLIEKGSPIVPTQVQIALEVSYPVIKERLASYSFSTSLTYAFDGLSDSPYLDFCHVNHIGNYIIAHEIWKIIGKKFP